jgi:iron complex outermembrane receptor protein
LDVVSDANGNPVCRSVLDGTDLNCVPWNIFTLGGVTPAALNYLQAPGFEKGFTEQSVVGATVGADLGQYGWRLPWSKDGVAISLGAERRVEKLDFQTDLEFSTFDLAGQGGPVIGRSGQYTVKELYGEVKVPILQDQPWAKLVSVNGSYRYSDYSTNKTTSSYGVGAEWAPVKEVRLRGSYQHAVRAANIVELFLAQGLNLFSFASDPCGGPTPTASLAQCLLTGLSPAQYGSNLLTNPAGQGNFLQGGNPNLDPERAKTYTVGAVFTPMRNLSGSVDYFKIKVDNVIQPGIAPALVLTQCLNAGQFCDLIHRDAKGTLWTTGFITATNLNLAKLTTSGVDVAANYNQPLPNNWGGISVDFKGTYTREVVLEPIPGLGEYDCAGFFGPTCLVPAPKWHHIARVTWSTPWNVDLSGAWRHSDKVKLDATSSNPLLSAPFNPPDAQMAERDYFDLAASWAITKVFTLYAGVNNIFDKDPPLVGAAGLAQAFGNGNTYPQVYDAFGRRVFLNLTAKF